MKHLIEIWLFLVKRHETFMNSSREEGLAWLKFYDDHALIALSRDKNGKINGIGLARTVSNPVFGFMRTIQHHGEKIAWVDVIATDSPDLIGKLFQIMRRKWDLDSIGFSRTRRPDQQKVYPIEKFGRKLKYA